MRSTRTTQTSLLDPPPADQTVADDLERVSGWLDPLPELADEVAVDLGAGAGDAAGRLGLPCEAVLRCALLMQMQRETYRGLEFLLRDSPSAQRFADGGDSYDPRTETRTPARVVTRVRGSWPGIARTLTDLPVVRQGRECDSGDKEPAARNPSRKGNAECGVFCSTVFHIVS